MESGGFIVLNTTFTELMNFVFTTQIINGLTLGWSIVYIILITIFLQMVFK